MQLRVEATDEELAGGGEAMGQLLQELCVAAEARLQARPEPLEKAARLSIKPHPQLAMTQLRRRWVTGYRQQMAAMLAEMAAFLDQATAPGAGVEPPPSGQGGG